MARDNYIYLDLGLRGNSYSVVRICYCMGMIGVIVHWLPPPPPVAPRSLPNVTPSGILAWHRDRPNLTCGPE